MFDCFNRLPQLFVLAWLAFFSLTRAGATRGAEVQNADEISFRYRGYTATDNSLAFPEGKKDFVWGTFSRDGNHFRLEKNSLGRVDPDDPSAYQLSALEISDFGQGILKWRADQRQVVVEDELSIEQAMRLAEDLPFEGGGLSEGNGMYIYEEHDGEAAELLAKYAARFPFLGFVKEGSLENLLAEAGNEQPIRLEDGKTYRFERNPETLFVTALRTTLPAERPSASRPKAADGAFASQDDRRFLGGRIEAEFSRVGDDQWALREVNEGRNTRIGKYTLTIEYAVSEMKNDAEWPFVLEHLPEDGDKIVLLDNQQIDAIWKDGKIVRAYDEGVAEELASAEFRRPANQAWLWIAIAVLTVGTGAWFFMARRGRMTR